MGYLCIPGYICILCFSRYSQGCRFPFLHKESFLIHKHSIFIQNKKTKQENVSQKTDGFMILNSTSLSLSSFFLMQVTVILPIDNNDIVNFGGTAETALKW